MVETDKKAVPATFIVVKGKEKGEMLLGCDTAMELGVLKIVNSIDKEHKELRPVVADIVSEYNFCSTASVNISTPRSRFRLMSLSCQLHK